MRNTPVIKKSRLKHYNRVLEFDYIIMQPDGKTPTGRYRYKCMKCGAKRNTSDKSKTFKSCVKCGVDCQHFYWENRIKALSFLFLLANSNDRRSFDRRLRL